MGYINVKTSLMKDIKTYLEVNTKATITNY